MPVRIDGDTATARYQLRAPHVKNGTPGGDPYLIAGRYSDRLVRPPDG